MEGFRVKGLFRWLFQKEKVVLMSFFPSIEVSQHRAGTAESFHSI